MTNEVRGAQPASGDGKGRTWIGAAVAGVLLHMTVGFFTVTAIGLVGVALWAIVVLVAGWLAAAALLVRTVRHLPMMAIAIPVANGLALWGLITAGEAWWGWTG